MSLKYFAMRQTLGFRKDLKNEKSKKIQSSSKKELKNRKKSEHRKAIGKTFKNRNFSCQIGRSGHPGKDRILYLACSLVTTVLQTFHPKYL